MASETYYYAWQNPVLRNTIYPFREMKLRDFLLIYKEVDLWAQNKAKNPNDPVIASRLQAIAQKAKAQRDEAGSRPAGRHPGAHRLPTPGLPASPPPTRRTCASSASITWTA